MAFRNRIVRLSQLVADRVVGAFFATATTGARIEIQTPGGAQGNRIRFFGGIPEEANPGAIYASATSTPATGKASESLFLASPSVTNVVNNSTTPNVFLTQSKDPGQPRGYYSDAWLQADRVHLAGDNEGVFVRNGSAGYQDLVNGGSLEGTLGDSGWIPIGATGAPAFQNGWANFGGGHDLAAIRKLHGVVHIRGLIRSGTMGAPAFALPVGWRGAPSTKMFAVVDGTNTGAGRLDIVGGINVTPTTGNNTFYTIACSFPADN